MLTKWQCHLHVTEVLVKRLLSAKLARKQYECHLYCFPHYNAWRLWTQFSPFTFQYLMSLLLSYDLKHSLICVDNWARKLVKNILTYRYCHMSAILIFKGPMYLTLWQLVIFTPLEMGCKCWCLILFQFLVSCVCMHVLVCMGHTQHKQEFLLV